MTLLRAVRVFAVAAAPLVSACAATPPDDPDAVGEDESATDEIVVGSFQCTPTIERSRPNAPRGQVVAARDAAHPTFDRFVIEFEARTGLPSFAVKRQDGARFTGVGEGAGAQFDLAGSAGLEVQLPEATAFTDTGGSTFHGAARFEVAGGQSLLEAAEVEDFEANTRWGLGLKETSCYRAFGLKNPSRLVVDVQHAP